MSTSNLANALIIVLSISAIIYLGQLAILEINPDQTFTTSGNMLYNYGNESGLQNFDGEELPDSAESVNVDTGNVFTDSYNTVKNWLVDTTGAKYVIGILGAPYNILQGFGLPSAVVWILGSVWYGVIIFLIISWARGV